MFIGEYETSVDDKGRIIVPARFREVARALEGPVGFMMTLGEENCITIYTPNQWKALQARVSSVPRNRESGRRLCRRVYTQAGEGVCDRQGRMRVPAPLLAAAGITREAVVAGVGDFLELWGRDAWRAYKEDMLKTRVSDAEEQPWCPPSPPTS
ncbi:MAG TPA: division/cell wall cluster transcriptional repressor MraZ [Planctomycetota bacterium]|nr:division/cell wall cluster transcriptional repressor MraZ [Planctomycetota bacterium]